MATAAPAAAPAAAPEHPPRLLFAGYLTKQGGSYRRWQRRWFELSPASLTYRERQDAAPDKKAIPLQSITVRLPLP
jgi:hypothetical protein